jgi:catechol 2,3-dioxygenase-like lactoylglutathione lyase family enzyme
MSDPGRRLATIALVVRDYDEAARWYTDKLGLALAEDADLGGGKRWVTLAGSGGARLLLAKAEGERQASRIGDQTGGRVFCSWRRMISPATTRRCWRRAWFSRTSRVMKPTARLRCSPISTVMSGI